MMSTDIAQETQNQKGKMSSIVSPTSFEYRREFLKVESPKPLTRQLVKSFSKGKYKVESTKQCPITDIWLTTFSRIVKKCSDS